MLRLLINLAIFVLVLRILRPLFANAGKVFRRASGSEPDGKGNSGKAEVEFPDLSPYEIEDAEFEEVPQERE